MKIAHPTLSAASEADKPIPTLPPMPGADALAALRAWYEGMSARDAVARYQAEQLVGAGASARSVIGVTRRALIARATAVQRDDIVALLQCPLGGQAGLATEVGKAIDALRVAPAPTRPCDAGQPHTRAAQCGTPMAYRSALFQDCAEAIHGDHPALSDKLLRVSPHWMRHTHASHPSARIHTHHFRLSAYR